MYHFKVFYNFNQELNSFIKIDARITKTKLLYPTSADKKVDFDIFLCNIWNIKDLLALFVPGLLLVSLFSIIDRFSFVFITVLLISFL